MRPAERQQGGHDAAPVTSGVPAPARTLPDAPEPPAAFSTRTPGPAAAPEVPEATVTGLRILRPEDIPSATSKAALR